MRACTAYASRLVSGFTIFHSEAPSAAIACRIMSSYSNCGVRKFDRMASRCDSIDVMPRSLLLSYRMSATFLPTVPKPCMVLCMFHMSLAPRPRERDSCDSAVSTAATTLAWSVFTAPGCSSCGTSSHFASCTLRRALLAGTASATFTCFTRGLNSNGLGPALILPSGEDFARTFRSARMASPRLSSCCSVRPEVCTAQSRMAWCAFDSPLPAKMYAALSSGFSNSTANFLLW